MCIYMNLFMLRADGQPQGQVLAMQPAPAPVVVIPPPSLLSRFRWYHAALAVAVLAASGAGTAVFAKVLLLLSPFICRVLR